MTQRVTIVDASTPAGHPAGADDERHVELVTAGHHQAHIALGGLFGKIAIAGAQIGGTAVGGSPVAADHMGFKRDPPLKGRFHEAGPKHPRCGQHSDFRHGLHPSSDDDISLQSVRRL